jgi:2,3-bisphosphoglycerate-independent phosphoglycerate mutase
VKYVVLIIDGASGWPAAALGGLTSLQAAHVPHLDRLAREGTVGLADNIPEGMEASSAVACMSVMGFDPAVHYAGRGPIEAMAMGVELEPGQVAMRCNLVTVLDGRLVSYSAGNIASEESAQLIAALRDRLGEVVGDGADCDRLGLHAGVGFRHILTVRDGADLLATTFMAPHDIADRPVAGSDPVGPGAGLVCALMEWSKGVLAGHPVNDDRIARGLLPATQIWLFWPGMKPARMPTFAESYGGRKAALTSAVDLLRGLALQTGMDCLSIPGVTDGGDNDYEAQIVGALDALADHDVVFVHVEAPDEASHAGDVQGKLRALEQIDALMIPRVVAMQERLAVESARAGAADEAPGVRLLVMSDHPTPVELKTHVAEPVPFVMWGPGLPANGAKTFSETEARATGFAVAPGHLLMSMFLGGSQAAT